MEVAIVGLQRIAAVAAVIEGAVVGLGGADGEPARAALVTGPGGILAVMAAGLAWVVVAVDVGAVRAVDELAVRSPSSSCSGTVSWQRLEVSMTRWLGQTSISPIRSRSLLSKAWLLAQASFFSSWRVVTGQPSR